MFARISTVFTFLFFILPVLTAASAVLRNDMPAPIPASQCNTGDLQCCNSIQSASDPSVTALAALLGIVLGPITGIVGLTCSPLSIIGISGTSCSAQPVCCTGDNFHGLIVAGCTPVNVNT